MPTRREEKGGRYEYPGLGGPRDCVAAAPFCVGSRVGEISVIFISSSAVRSVPAAEEQDSIGYFCCWKRRWSWKQWWLLRSYGNR